MKEVRSKFDEAVRRSQLSATEIAVRNQTSVAAVSYLRREGIKNITTAKRYAQVLDVDFLSLID
mgnify:CR=1 FL=1